MTGPQQNIPNKTPNLSFGVTGCLFRVWLHFRDFEAAELDFERIQWKNLDPSFCVPEIHPKIPPKGRDFKYLEDPGIDA